MKKVKGRHELKHYINYADLLQLRTRLSIIADRDIHGAAHGYRVKSLYFDNFNDKVLKEKVDGINGREKFRLRFYNEDISFICLEKKSKRNGICFKEKVRISATQCQRLLVGDITALKENGSSLCMELYIKMHDQQLRAKNIVDYHREAFVYPMGNVRVTLDYDLRTGSRPGVFLKAGIMPIPLSGIFILEVKYDNFLPEIIRGMVSLSGRKSTAFSKYAATRII